MTNHQDGFTPKQQAFLDSHLNHTVRHDFMGVFCITCDKDITQDALDLELTW